MNKMNEDSDVRPCPFCHDGYVKVDSLRGYRCPDCDGTGYIGECRECGETMSSRYLNEEGICEDCEHSADALNDSAVLRDGTAQGADSQCPATLEHSADALNDSAVLRDGTAKTGTTATIEHIA